LFEELKVRPEWKNCDLVVIPGGITSQHQPPDVSINKPPKDYLRKEYKAWLLSENLPKLVGSQLLRRRSQQKQGNSHPRNSASQMYLLA
jgi:hypothetical protein